MQHSIVCAAAAMVLCIASGVHANAQQKPLTLNRPGADFNRPASDFKFAPDTLKRSIATKGNAHDFYREQTLGGHEAGFMTPATDHRRDPERLSTRNNNWRAASPSTESANLGAQKYKADVAKGKARRSNDTLRDSSAYAATGLEGADYCRRHPYVRGCAQPASPRAPTAGPALMNNTAQRRGNAAMDMLEGM